MMVIKMLSEDEELSKVISVTRLCAQIILENGGEAYRAEETVYRICNAFGFEQTDVVALPIGVFITVSKHDGPATTVIKRIKKHTVNLTAIDAVNNISRQLTHGTITLEQASIQLRCLHMPKPDNRLIAILAAGLSSGCFALLFGGNPFDFAIATICGMITRFVTSFISVDDMFNFALSILGGFIIGFVAIVSVKIAGTGNLDKIIIGALMPLLPGISMTNAIRDTMRGDLVSGVAGGAQALLIAIALAFGVGMLLKLSYIIF